MQEAKRNDYIYAAAFSVNLISFASGSSYSWTSPVLPKLQSSCSEINPLPEPTTTFQDSWITSLLSLGAAFGPFLAGPMSEKLGRKKTMLIFAFPMLLSHMICAFANNVALFMAARFLLGIGVGSFYSVLPNYIGEISEDTNRGRLGCIMGFMIALGNCFIYLVGPFLSIRDLSFINTLPILMFYVLFGFFIPESPYYLVSIKENTKAENALRKFRKSATEGMVKKELMYISDLVESSKANKKNFKDLIKSKSLIKALVIGNGLMFFQQFSGICAVLGYMQSIFLATGSKIPPHISVILIGLVQILTVAITTQLVDRLGRRILMFISTTGCFLSLATLGAFFFLKNNDFEVDNIATLPVISLLVYITTYNLGLGPLSWAIMGEIFPANVKSAASAFTSFVCLILAFFITMFFPYVVFYLGMAQSFWLFSVFCGLGAIFTVYVVPETKGKSFKDIQNLLDGEK